MSCPLTVRKANDKLITDHVHDPCLCLDEHPWSDVDVCPLCGARRCTIVRTAGLVRERCSRAASHAGRHL